MPPLDDLDLAILTALEENARIPISELARRLGAPGSTLRDRIRGLEQEGVILGYTALVDLIAKEYLNELTIWDAFDKLYLQPVLHTGTGLYGVWEIYNIQYQRTGVITRDMTWLLGSI